jgi:hypothetical protein
MIRKQVYLDREQNRKLKALAARRGCTEAAIMREALDRLPEPNSHEALDTWPEADSDPDSEEQFLARLRADGLLAPKPTLATPLSREEWERQRREFDEWLDAHPEDLKLTEAVLENRGPR